MSLNVSFVLTNFPAGYCWTTPQAYATDLIALLTGSIPDTFNTFNYGNSTPAAGDQDKPWLRLNTDGSPDRWYVYSGGQWVWTHPIPASGNERKIWVGTNDAAGLWAYDGGDGTDPAGATPTTGSFWTVDTQFDFRVPLGVGTSGVIYPPAVAATTIAVLGTLGAEKVALGDADADELPSHRHFIANSDASGNAAPLSTNQLAQGSDWNPPGPNDYDLAGTAGACNVLRSSLTGGNPTVAHQNMPPCLGCYFIKRSARIFYVAP